MAKPVVLSSEGLKATIYFLILTITLQCTTSARLLGEVKSQPPAINDLPDISNLAPTISTLPGGHHFPATVTTDKDNISITTDPPIPEPEAEPLVIASQPVDDVVPSVAPVADVASKVTTNEDNNSITIESPIPEPEAESPVIASQPVDDVVPSVAPVADVAPKVTTDEDNNSFTIDPPIPEPEAEPPVIASQHVDDVAPIVALVADVAPETGSTSEENPVVGTSATSANTAGEHTPKLSFYMHDILGGSHPSARVVTGIAANSEINGIPFSKTKNKFFPISGGTPLVNLNNINNMVNQNTYPLLTGLNGGQHGTALQNKGTSNIVSGNGKQPSVSSGQLPTGASLQQLMFGSITVVNDKLTKSHELGSGVIGKSQGFYIASSLDGTSHTIVLTASLHGDDHQEVEDTITFFGVHRPASHVSNIVVVGGTGKYKDAQGYATIETLHVEDQHATDGVDTIAKIDVYLY